MPSVGLLRLEHVFVWLLLRSGLLMTGGLCIRSIWSGGLCQGAYDQGFMCGGLLLSELRFGGLCQRSRDDNNP